MVLFRFPGGSKILVRWANDGGKTPFYWVKVRGVLHRMIPLRKVFVNTNGLIDAFGESSEQLKNYAPLLEN